MVRRAERALRHQPRTRRKTAGDGVNTRRLQRFGEGQRRQNARQTACQHRLARTGRADHQQVMSAAGRHFQRPPCANLPLHLCHIHRALDRRYHVAILPLLLHGDGFAPLQVIHHLPQAARRIDPQSLNARHFLGVPFRQNNVHNPLLARADDHRQRAAHGVQRTIQRQFAQHQRPRQVHALQLPRRHQDADGNRQIERRAFLSLVGGREIHRQARNGHGKSAVDDGGAHAVAALLDRRIRQSDNLQRRHPRRRVDLHLHCESADAAQAVSQRSCKHERSTPSPWYSVSIVHHIAHNYKRALSIWRDFVYSGAERMQHPRELRFATMRRRMPPMQKRWR